MDKGQEDLQGNLRRHQKRAGNLICSWLKQEAEALMSRKSPSGTVGETILEHLRKRASVK